MALEWLANWMGEHHGLSVEVSADPEVTTDREDVKILIFEAVRELLFNVVKHSGTTRARLNMSRFDDESLKVEVRDRGVGYDPENVAGRSIQDDAVPGTSAGGFGLFSIRERLGLIGGRLEVESAPNEGACFTLIAPMGRGGVRPEREEPAAESPQPQPTLEPATEDLPEAEEAERKIRILLVDDHDLVREGLSLLLNEEPGFEIAGQASDGKEAVRVSLSYPDPNRSM